MTSSKNQKEPNEKKIASKLNTKVIVKKILKNKDDMYLDMNSNRKIIKIESTNRIAVPTKSTNTLV